MGSMSAVALHPEGAGLRLLGRFELSSDDCLLRVRPSGERLLAYLAVRPGPVARQEAAAALGPDCPDVRSAANLRPVLWRLPGREGGMVRSHARGIALVPGVSIDLEEISVALLGCQRGRERFGAQAGGAAGLAGALGGRYPGMFQAGAPARAGEAVRPAPRGRPPGLGDGRPAGRGELRPAPRKRKVASTPTAISRSLVLVFCDSRASAWKACSAKRGVVGEQHAGRKTAVKRGEGAVESSTARRCARSSTLIRARKSRRGARPSAARSAAVVVWPDGRG
jgi:hypothetical protein